MQESVAAVTTAVEGGRVDDLSQLLELLRIDSLEQLGRMLTAEALASDDLLSHVIMSQRRRSEAMGHAIAAADHRALQTLLRVGSENSGSAAFHKLLEDHDCSTNSPDIFRMAAGIVEHVGVGPWLESYIDLANYEARRRHSWVLPAVALVFFVNLGRLPNHMRRLHPYGDNAAFREHCQEAGWHRWQPFGVPPVLDACIALQGLRLPALLTHQSHRAATGRRSPDCAPPARRSTNERRDTRYTRSRSALSWRQSWPPD